MPSPLSKVALQAEGTHQLHKVGFGVQSVLSLQNAPVMCPGHILSALFNYIPCHAQEGTTAARGGLSGVLFLTDGWETARFIQVATTYWKLRGFGRANKGWTTMSGPKLHRVVQALPSHLKCDRCDFLLRSRTVIFRICK